MNEFIVWDKLKKCFADDVCCDVRLLKNDISYSLEIRDELFELFYNIGLKDINGKNIYADSSIVEFEWVNSFGNIQTDWGVFKYDIDYLQYLIYEENENINKSSIKDVLNIKIIDTIQENKLGLIK